MQAFNSEKLTLNSKNISDNSWKVIPKSKSAIDDCEEYIGGIELSADVPFIGPIFSTKNINTDKYKLGYDKNTLIFGVRSINDKIAFIKNILKTAEYNDKISPIMYSKTLVRENIRCDLPIHCIFDDLARINVENIKKYIKTHTTPISGLIFLDLTHTLTGDDNEKIMSLVNIIKNLEENCALKINLIVFGDNFGIDNYLSDIIDATIIYNIRSRGKLQSAYDRFAKVNIMSTTQFCERCQILKSHEFACFYDGKICYDKIDEASKIHLISDFWIRNKFGELFVDDEQKIIKNIDEVVEKNEIVPENNENNEIVAEIGKKNIITISIDNIVAKNIKFSFEIE